MNVRNRKCIRKLSFRTLWASRKRNLVAVLAIVLTTLLFTSLFTIALSINSSYEEYTFRQIGGYSHGSFKNVTAEKVDALSGHRKVKDYGLRTTIGFIMEAPFSKTPAEISWMDANTAKWSYAIPSTGHMPESGMEIAMDTEALRKLGIPAKLGEQVKLTYALSDSSGSITASVERTEVFTLVGFWEYDALMPVHYINISEEYMKQAETRFISAGGAPFRTDMNVMLASSLNIRSEMESIVTDLGFQWENRNAENCVRIGTNWGYTTAELGSNFDPTMLVAITAFLILIIFTGYLIIYNIFQISVSNDIRFYGLLKTIGTTPKQIKRIVRWQAIYLSVIGIPIGCLFGYGVGAILTPKVISTSNLSTVKLSTSPLIFIVAALFSLITVWLSCARPGKKPLILHRWKQ